MRRLRVAGLGTALIATGWSGPGSELATETVFFDIRVELPVEPERSRNAHERRQEFFPTGLEGLLRSQLRMDRTPYTCASLVARGLADTEIEHIVAIAEARDSGLPAEDVLDFSHDPGNLTLALKEENLRKGARDASDYLPEHNQCWFAGRVIAVKQRWSLSVDAREAVFLKTALAGCSAADIARPRCEAIPGGGAPVELAPEEWLERCDRNENRRVTCSEAFACRAPLPVTREHPLYGFMSDGDGDGLVCE